MPRRKTCPKCGKVKFMTSHHVFPKRFFGENKKDRVELCRDCHDKLEKYIPVKEKQDKQFYVLIVSFFLGKF